MDFALDDEQQAVSELADRILGEQCPPETLRTLEAGPIDDRLAADAWIALAGADLLGLAVPATLGGSGLGILDAGLVAEQVGRHVALVPYWTSTAAMLSVARWGDDGQRDRWIPGAVAGTEPLAVALWQPAELGSPTHPAVTAQVESGGGWSLYGTKSPVPWASHVQGLLVPAFVDDAGVGVFLVDTAAPGLELVEEQSITREPTQTVHFDGVPVPGDALLGGHSNAETVAGWLGRCTTLLLCMTALGVCEEALALTARHVTEREQFGSPIGTFQAVAHRCADAYVDTEAIRLTALQAAWQLDHEDPAATSALAIAAFWATEGGQRVVHAAQHLHGGIGVDTDYPLHRYFRWAKVLEALLGGTHGALGRLGESLAAGDLVT